MKGKIICGSCHQRIRHLEDPLPTVQLNGPILMVVAGIAGAVVMLAAHSLYIWLH